jgi:hypothetical protein
MAGSLRSRNRRDVSATHEPTVAALDMDEPTSDLEIYSK